MFTLEGKLTLKQVVEQGFAEIREGFLEGLKRSIEGLLVAERDRRVAELRQRGEKVYRWGYTLRKCWQTLWGASSKCGCHACEAAKRSGCWRNISVTP